MSPIRSLIRIVSRCFIFESRHWNSFEDRTAVYFSYVGPISKWVAEIWGHKYTKNIFLQTTQAIYWQKGFVFLLTILNEHEDIDQCSPYANAIQANAILHLCCKVGQPKWNLYRVIVLTRSGTNYVMMILTNMVHIHNTIWANAMLQLSYKFGEPNCNPYWVIMLTSSFGTNYVLN